MALARRNLTAAHHQANNDMNNIMYGATMGVPGSRTSGMEGTYNTQAEKVGRKKMKIVYRGRIEAISGLRKEDLGDIIIKFHAGHYTQNVLVTARDVLYANPDGSVELNSDEVVWEESWINTSTQPHPPAKFVTLQLLRENRSRRGEISRVHLGTARFNVTKDLFFDWQSLATDRVADWYPLKIQESSFDKYDVFVFTRLSAHLELDQDQQIALQSIIRGEDETRSISSNRRSMSAHHAANNPFYFDRMSFYEGRKNAPIAATKPLIGNRSGVEPRYSSEYANPYDNTAW